MTCKNCIHYYRCPERSREYPCIGFKENKIQENKGKVIKGVSDIAHRAVSIHDNPELLKGE